MEEEIVASAVVVSPGAEESPPLGDGAPRDVVREPGPLLEGSEAEVVGTALLGAPVSSGVSETLLDVPVGEWCSVGEAAELGKVLL